MLKRNIIGMVSKSTMQGLRALLTVGLLGSLCDGFALSWIGAAQNELAAHIPRTFANNVRMPRNRRDIMDTTVMPATITSLRIVSQIGSRFSETVATSVIHNPTQDNKEAEFTLDIPEKAFISNFTMIIDGQLIVSQVKSKKEADRLYEEAKTQNKTAGKVSSSGQSRPQEVVPGMERFTVAIAVRANSSIEFELTYLQLLERINGMYEQVISMRPQQIVPDFQVDVYIYDKQGVTDLSIFEPALGTNSLEYEIARVNRLSDYQQHVSFHPSVEQQRKMDAKLGVNRELVVSYDVIHGNNGGLLEVENGHFAHYFSPDDTAYSPLSKHIVFVIDISGSMSGNKIAQTRDAFQTIIEQLRDQDTFMLLLFESQLHFWPEKDRVVQATGDNKRAAKDYAARKLYPDGSTNIADALVAACNTLRRQNNPRGSNLVMFLTDGQPTVGETHPDRIVNLVMDAAAGQVAIYSLAFGSAIDFELLQKLAWRTNGDVHKIYDRASAKEQLTSFYTTIDSPIIYDIEVTYPTNIVRADSVTQTRFDQHFSGSELIMVGQLIDNVLDKDSFEATVTGQAKKPGVNSIHDILMVTTSISEDDLPTPTTDVSTPSGFIEKLYVYEKIKFLLKEKLMTDDSVKQAALEKQALELALEYHLVTPLTSMIIVQPDRPPPSFAVQDDSYFRTGSAMSSAASSGSGVVLHMVAWLILGSLFI